MWRRKKGGRGISFHRATKIARFSKKNVAAWEGKKGGPVDDATMSRGERVVLPLLGSRSSRGGTPVRRERKAENRRGGGETC